jgi:hypothetical protein
MSGINSISLKKSINIILLFVTVSTACAGITLLKTYPGKADVYVKGNNNGPPHVLNAVNKPDRISMTLILISKT